MPVYLVAFNFVGKGVANRAARKIRRNMNANMYVNNQNIHASLNDYRNEYIIQRREAYKKLKNSAKKIGAMVGLNVFDTSKRNFSSVKAVENYLNKLGLGDDFDFTVI